MKTKLLKKLRAEAKSYYRIAPFLDKYTIEACGEYGYWWTILDLQNFNGSLLPKYIADTPEELIDELNLLRRTKFYSLAAHHLYMRRLKKTSKF